MLGDPSLSSLYSNVFSDARVGIFAWPRTCYKSSPVHRLSYIECWSRQHNVRTRVNKKILSQSVRYDKTIVIFFRRKDVLKFNLPCT